MSGTDVFDLGDAVPSDTERTEVLCSGSDKWEFRGIKWTLRNGVSR